MRRTLCIGLILGLSFVASAEVEEPYKKTSTAPHEMRVINSGFGALYARVDMIRRAKKSIELETFIFEDDTSGKIILNELVAAAKRGVKVRILLDKTPLITKLDEYTAKELKDRNVELRYYNPLSTGLQNIGFRNHKKLLVRDDEEAILGGRNIGDAYFDLSESMNYLDRDVTVEGEVVKSMKETFEKFWTSKLTKKLPDVVDPLTLGVIDKTAMYEKAYFDRKTKEAKALFVKDAHMKEVLERLKKEGKEKFLELTKKKCPEVTFISDKEGGSSKETKEKEKYIKEYRKVSREIKKWLDSKIGSEQFIVDSPYYLTSDVTKKILQKLKDKKIKMELLTNSLASTDAIHVASVFKERVKDYTSHAEFKGFVYRGNYGGDGDIRNEKVRRARWATHAKTVVFNDRAFLIGSYNMDNRSSFFNTEMAIFCNGSPELTKDVKANIQRRIYNSLKLNREGEEEDCIPGIDIGVLKEFEYLLLKLPARLKEDDL